MKNILFIASEAVPFIKTGGLAMSKLGVVEDTLFVPMLGRIYASEHYPQILYDKKAYQSFWFFLLQ